MFVDGKVRDKKNATEDFFRRRRVLESFKESYGLFDLFLESFAHFLESFREFLESFSEISPQGVQTRVQQFSYTP